MENGRWISQSHRSTETSFFLCQNLFCLTMIQGINNNNNKSFAFFNMHNTIQDTMLKLLLVSGEARSHWGSANTDGGRAGLSDNLLDHLIVAQSQLKKKLIMNNIKEKLLEVLSFRWFQWSGSKIS